MSANPDEIARPAEQHASALRGIAADGEAEGLADTYIEREAADFIDAQAAEIERLRGERATLAEALAIFTSSQDVSWTPGDTVYVGAHRDDYRLAIEAAASCTNERGSGE